MENMLLQIDQNCMLLQIDQNWRFQHRIKQMNVYKEMHIQINYDSAALNWLLFVTKSSNWGIKMNKTEIISLKFKK